MALTSIIDRFRICLLVKKGLTIGKDVYIGGKVSIDPTFCRLISIGNECTLAGGVVILAHDASTKKHINYTKVGRVTIGNRTFIGASSVILPNVKIGDNVIIGAGSVVTNDIPNGVVAAGNPARIIKTTKEYIELHKAKLNRGLQNKKPNQEIIIWLNKESGYIE
jgi:maltose O-acetyltransferase